MIEPGVRYHRVAAGDCLDHAARLILEAGQARSPDLSDVIVLLPNLFAAQPLSERLARLARHSLLLPRFVTFSTLAQSTPLAQAVVPTPRRQGLIHDALRAASWFRAGSLWQAADELLTLIDQLALHAPDVAKSSELRLGAGRLLEVEAQLVASLSAALHDERDRALDPVAALQAQLERIEAQAPLIVVGIERRDALQTRFLERYARGQPVHAVESVLRDEDSPRAALLAAAWPEAALPADAADAAPPPALTLRAERLRAAHPHSPAREWLRLCDAPALESAAQAAVLQVQRWLAAGWQRIAIVAQDRFATRRVRALLERAGVLAQDEAGWRLSTTAASTVLMRWLDALAAEFGYRELFDFLSSPFVMADSPPSERQRVLAQIEALARKENWVRGLASLQHLLDKSGSEHALSALARIAAAAQVFLGERGADSAAFAAGAPRVAGRNTLSRWIELLERSLHLLGVDQALAEDAAGQQLLARLAERREQLGGQQSARYGAAEGQQSARYGAAHVHATRYSFAQFRDWLSHDLESTYFLDASVDSPVVITQLSNMRLRAFDAVVVVGADEEHLFGAPPAGFFNERVRAQLGLPTHTERVREQLHALCEALLLAKEALLVWQNAAEGAPRSASAYVERLVALHEQCYGGDALHDPALEALLAARQAHAPALTPEDYAGRSARVPAAPRPAPASPLIPARVSVSAYQSLVKCPYQFFAAHVLGLKQGDEVREEMDKRDFGSFVHSVLHRFHQTHATLHAPSRAQAREELLAIAEDELAHWQRRSAVNRAWRLRWEGLVGDYIRWQSEWEEQGWGWQEGEGERSLPLALAAGGELVLHGRIDRVDVRTTPDGTQHALIDYKTRNAGKLRSEQKKPGEDVQLPAYVALYGGDVAQAGYLSVDQDEVDAVMVKNIAALAANNLQRLRAVFDAMHAGAALPAQGVSEVCQHCEARGLCRRDVWV